MYDDIYRIPFIARIPGLTHGTKCDDYVQLIDMTATFMERRRIATWRRWRRPLRRGGCRGWRGVDGLAQNIV